jgi:predicted kinase
LLFAGARVLVDANFRVEAQRVMFLEAARRWGVPPVFLCCEAEPDKVRNRLADRHEDASDADWSVYLRASQAWQQPGAFTRSYLHKIDTGRSAAQSLSEALDVLRRQRLLD